MKNMETFSLSTVLAVLLFTSVSPVMAMQEESFDAHSIPRFPLNAYGEDINQQDYSITGHDIKNLLRHPSPQSPAAQNGITDNQTYLGFGVTATNLRDYQTIPDDVEYLLQWNGNEWRVNGFIPNSHKRFTLEIDQDYAP